MDYKIFTPDGVVVNTIVAPNSSFVENYCAKYGYTYERIEEEETDTETTTATEDIILGTLADHEYRLCLTELGVN